MVFHFRLVNARPWHPIKPNGVKLIADFHVRLKNVPSHRQCGNYCARERYRERPALPSRPIRQGVSQLRGQGRAFGNHGRQWGASLLKSCPGFLILTPITRR